MEKIMETTKPEGFKAGKKLMARVLFDGSGSVPHDVDVTHMSTKNELTTQELKECVQEEEGTHFFFTRWE